jgi:hypothetical protein
MNFQEVNTIKVDDLDISDPIKKIAKEAIKISDCARNKTDSHHYYTDMPSHEHYRDS